ncbi:hypothetical protein LTR37_002104 [Vermiconidia calcicola]|uniref:Uncharacterized protein n=1 Tax=Vermiconidia calcicola TaxID=1690605 RepID=A0ACC3NTM7_9PEZI|nr:hypothetical protein LTR37_002104 [Vermiconidia calcicola]
MPDLKAQGDTADGWVSVKRGKGSRQLCSTPRQPLPDRHITVQTLEAKYDRDMQTWKQSACRKELRQILDKKQPDEGWQIKEAVCFASGSFSRDNWEAQRRSMLQFVAFIDTAQYIEAGSSDTIGLFAQEPMYTPVDVEFLSGMGIKVSTLRAVRYNMESESMMFELFMDMNLDAALNMVTIGPKLFIGAALTSRLAQFSKHLTDAEIREYLQIPAEMATPPQSDKLCRVASRLKDDFEVQRLFYKFPRFDEDPKVFEGLNIYWKEPRELEEG